MSVKIITNTTGSAISITEAGKDLAAAEVYVIYPQHYPMWAYAARTGSFLATKINAGDITVSDGLTPVLNAALGLALLRDILARNISFDNRANGFASSNVQSAIEEAQGASVANDFLITFDCDASVAVGNIVVPSLTVDFKVDALSSNVYNGLVLGVVASKPTVTSCKVRVLGPQDGFSGLVRGQPVYVSTSGVPTTTFPASGHKQTIGVAVSSSRIIIYVEMSKVVR